MEIPFDAKHITPGVKASPKLKIYDGTPTPADVVCLRLIEVGLGEIMLAAVDALGECLVDDDSSAHAGGLLVICGPYIVRSVLVMPALGFDLDVHGRVNSDPELDALTAKRSQYFGGKRSSFRAVD